MSTPDPDSEKRKRDAEAVLFRTIQVTDPGTGVSSARRVETPLYRDYLVNEAAYIKARAAYTEALQEAQKTEAGRGTWPMIASTLQLSVKQAYDRWRAAGAIEIEQARAILGDDPKPRPKGQG